MAEYLPNDKHADKVASCVRAGIVDPARIAKLLRITEKQLVDNYPYELGMTDDEDLQVVADVGFRMASSGKFPHMTMWWLRCKGGHMWQDKKNDDIGTNVNPIVVVLKGDTKEESNG